MESAEPGLRLRYSFRDTAGVAGPWIPYRGPVSLDAAVGEQRDYRVLVRADADGVPRDGREISVRIDKRIPPAPRITPDSGTYWDSLPVSFAASPQDTVYYAVQGDVVRQPVRWDGRNLALGRPNEQADYVVQAYTESQSGVRSRIVSARYHVDARAAALDLLSPVSGTFANPQALAVTFRNVAWVRYTLDGSDPATGGTAYTGPVTVDRQGTVTIRVAAQPLSAARPVLRREVSVTYTPAEGTGLRLDTESGSYPAGISPHVLSFPGGSLYGALWDKTPTESDLLVTTGIPVSSQTGGPSPVVIRLRALSDSGDWGPEYRYFYFVGNGEPAAPRVALQSTGTGQGPGRAQVTAPEDCLLSMTTDGTAPDPRTTASSTWVDVPSAPGAAASIKAVAVDGSGARSATTEARLSAASAAGPAPVASFGAGPVAGTAVLSVASGSRAVAYELTSDGSDPRPPSVDSPRLETPLSVSVPFGADRTFKARTALLDDAGRASAPSEVVSFTVNREPPREPKPVPPPGLLDEPASVALGSAARMYFTMTADGSTPKDPDPRTLQPATFISLPGVSGTAVTYRVKLVAADNQGNLTEVYGPLVYTVDLRPPVVPPMKGITDGGRYSTRQVSPVLDESAWTIRYTATNDGSEPA
ncbi:MAG TPA: chitobiase/beta-hexosaminidase C-terminal domain-containing protein, partial [Spirochaetia bacterium]|nr:chitobiase/beta-hexosaminidase C-terminal domain-containing protein [Spirochaetia bacterium]